MSNNKTTQWTPEQYRNYMANQPKRESKDKKKLRTMYESKEFKDHIETSQTLFPLDDITPKNDKENKYRTIELTLSGQPMPKQSFKTGLQRFRSDGYHTCPWTKQSVFHKKGDVFVYTNNRTGRPDGITIAYTDSKYTKRIEEYRLMIHNQLPDDFKMFTEEVHIESLEFIFKPLKSFSNKVLDGLKNKTLLKYHTVRPDMPDNLKKLPLDAMSGIVYKDDSLICTENNVVKRYGWKPGIIIKLKGI